jgi:hypothetical protein
MQNQNLTQKMMQNQNMTQKLSKYEENFKPEINQV